MPQVPTLQEQGVALTTSIIQAIFAPARTPAPIVARLNQAMAAAMATSAMIEVFRAQAAVPEHTTPQSLAGLVRVEQEEWGSVVRSENIRLD